MAELVDDEVLVERGVLEEDEVAGRVAAEAPEARHAEQPRDDEQPDSAHVDGLGVELEAVEPSLRAFEHLAPLQGTPGRIRTFDLCLRRAALYPLSYGRSERSV